MSFRSLANWSRSSTSSKKSIRSGKSLIEKIRDLGFNFHTEKASTRVSMQLVDIKLESNRSSNYSIMTPNLNLEQIIYYQPEVSNEEITPGRNFYKFTEFETTSKGPKDLQRISDIEVKSYKPTKIMIFRKRKRQSSIISRIETILNKGKSPLPSRDPSEETVTLYREPDPEINIHSLPESTLQKIFLHFSQRERNIVLSRVCKWVDQSKPQSNALIMHLIIKYTYRSWYYILKDPMFWPELVFVGERISKDTIIQLIRRYPMVKKLYLIHVLNVIDILQELCRCNHSVTDLAVKHCDIGNQNFGRIILHVLSCCTNLESLNIKGMQFQSDRFFLEIGRLTNLRSINLTGNKLIRSQNLITLSVNCRNLEELRILDISTESGQGPPLRDEDLTFILFHLQPNLKTLKIDMQQLRNVSFQAILKCLNLTCLAMKNCLHLSSETFRQFLVLSKLKKLKFTRAINLQPEDFQFVFASENMSTIEDLDINGCWGVGEKGLQAITHRLKNLKSLSLKNCKSIQGKHLTHLYCCPELTHLNIAHTEVELYYLSSLHQYVRKLRSLVIDTSMSKEPVIQKLLKRFHFLKIIVSFSEFQKDERPLEE